MPESFVEKFMEAVGREADKRFAQYAPEVATVKVPWSAHLLLTIDKFGPRALPMESLGRRLHITFNFVGEHTLLMGFSKGSSYDENDFLHFAGALSHAANPHDARGMQTRALHLTPKLKTAVFTNLAPEHIEPQVNFIMEALDHSIKPHKPAPFAA